MCTWLAVADRASARAVARSRMLSKYGCFSSWRERGRSSFTPMHTEMKPANSRLATLPSPAGRTPCRTATVDHERSQLAFSWLFLAGYWVGFCKASPRYTFEVRAATYTNQQGHFLQPLVS